MVYKSSALHPHDGLALLMSDGTRCVNLQLCRLSASERTPAVASDGLLQSTGAPDAV